MPDVQQDAVGQHHGFTLVEMIVVLAIIGILTALAFPAYQQYVVRSNRADVQGEMVQIAQRIQNHKLIRGSYTGVALNLPNIYGSPQSFPQNGDPLYDLGLEIVQSDGLVTNWIITATPKSVSVQKDDGALRLNDLGYRCWEKGSLSCTLTANSDWTEN